MAGHALAIHDAFPTCQIIGVEPLGADDFHQSLQAGKRVSIEQPTSICDGLLSYDVGEKNWPILNRLVRKTSVQTDEATKRAMAWVYSHHGLRTEPSGAITLAALLDSQTELSGEGDIVIVISGRNIDDDVFRSYLSDVA